jgi:hypothetical protein
MKRPAYAKIPSSWVRPPKMMMQMGELTPSPIILTTPPPPDFVAVDESPGANSVLYAKGGLAMLQWRQHKGAATAALLLLFALSVISNRAQRRDGLRKDEMIGATYEQIQAMIPLSRKLIADGLQLLQMVGAIRPVRDGRRNLYALVGINEAGKWCQLPQQHLHNTHSYLHRLQVFVDQIRRPTSLHALKLYMLLLSFRENHANFAAISYEKIMQYTLLRREEISVAIQLLVAAQLCRLLSDEEVPRRREDPKHNRYYICGLVAA